jgi:2-polyprenyl-3-methyl-5-hydroxy-6-metoxy-1,4-benzoquinol methylase
MKITSPITDTSEAQLDTQLDARKIVDGYRNELGYDASGYYSGLQQLEIYKCQQTGYRFFYPSRLAGDESLYRHLEKYDWYYSRWKWENDFVLGMLATNDRLLDVGCGNGFFIKGLAERGFHAEGIELNRSAVETARAQGLNVTVASMEEYIASSHGNYDVVCAMQVLEHIYDVRSFVQTAIQLVRPGGKLIIAVPNNNPYLYRYEAYHWLNLPPHHMGLWNKDALSKAAKWFGLECEQVVAEPIQSYERYHYFSMDAEHRKLGVFKKLYARVRTLLNRMSGRVIEGRNLVAVYRKPKIVAS